MPSSELTTTKVSGGVAACAPKAVASAPYNKVGINRFIDTLSTITRLRCFSSVGGKN
ncbi:Uncharacterised protein [Acinetobacter baumannii]|nr:Uncharacterised protein [Acinetobacter baumannii]